MKEIKAIIQPFMAEKVISALMNIEGLPGITLSEVQGFGRTRGRTAEEHHSTAMQFVKKTKIEVVVADSLAESVIAAIEEHARTGNVGDGKIVVHQVDDVVRIRTGERGESAI